MDIKALLDLSYGMYVVSTMSNDKKVGCFVNTVTQITAENPIISVSVNKLNYTARDHCPYCLYSKHLDINPGDRANECEGLLRPIGIEKFKDTYKIVYECF